MACEVTLFSLPLHDVLFPHIFCHLDILDIWRDRVVCRRFLIICNEYFRVCPAIDLRKASGQLDRYIGVVQQILQRCERLQKFYMRGIHFSSVLPATLAEKHKSVVFTLANCLSNLKVLSLESVELHHVHDCMRVLANCCTQLRELVLCSISPFDDEALNLLTHDCKSLVKLTIRNVTIKGHSLVKLTSQCHDLKQLCVAYCHHINLSHLEEVFKTSLKLTSVDLRYIGPTSDRTLLVLGEYCQQLQFLFVEGCAKVTEKTLTPLRERGVQVDESYQQQASVPNVGRNPASLPVFYQI